MNYMYKSQERLTDRICRRLSGGVLLVFILTVLMGIGVNAETNISVSAVLKDAKSIAVVWNADDPTAAYELSRSVGGTEEFVVINNFTGVSGEQEYLDTNVSKGNTYYYKLRKLIGETAAGESEIVSVKMTLMAPSGLAVSTNKNGIPTITWKKVNGAKSYIIYRRNNSAKKSKNRKYKKIKTIKKTSYTDTSVKAGYAYSYKIIAADGNDEHKSPYSEEIYNFIKVNDIEINGTYTKKKVKLTWNEVPAASSYVIYKKNSSGKYEKIAETEKTSYADSKVKKGKQYKYKVEYVVKLPDNTTVKKKSGVYSMYASEIDPSKKMVAITFDDGPGPYTQEIVDCLKKNNAKATFFVLGCNVNNYKSAVKNAYDIGCEIGNHSYDHTILTRLSAEQVKKQMSDTDEKVKNVIGAKTTIMRCPGGGVNKTVQNAVGKPIVHWSIDTLDWKTRSTEKTISSVMNNVKDGDIVLMHDIHAPTKRAALSIIPQLKKKGYQLVTVSELAKYRGYKLQNGTVYHSLRKKK